jgi:hypothetical protein
LDQEKSGNPGVDHQSHHFNTMQTLKNSNLTVESPLKFLLIFDWKTYDMNLATRANPVG